MNHGEIDVAGKRLLTTSITDENVILVRNLREGQEESPGKILYGSRSWTTGPDQQYAVRKLLKISADTWPAFKFGDKHFIFHFGGARRKTVLNMIKSNTDEKLPGWKVTDWLLVMPSEDLVKPEWLSEVIPGLLQLAISDNIDGLERSLGRPYANKKLPLSLRVEEIKQWLQLEDEIKAIKESNWIYLSDNEVNRRLVAMFS